MGRQLVIRGVPTRIQQDGWWLAMAPSDSVGGARPPEAPAGAGWVWRAVSLPGLLALVLLADWLFWERDLGLSVALFALALSALILASRPQGATRKEWLVWAGVEVMLNLPLVELLQPLSLLFSGVGIIAIAAWVAYDRLVNWWQALWLMLRASTVGASVLPVTLVKDTAELRPGPELKRNLLALLLPAGVGLVFLLLLAAANPILDRTLQRLAALDFVGPDAAWRVLFWAITAVVLWPYLNLKRDWVGPVATGRAGKRAGTGRFSSIFNATSVRNSLVLFNAMFLVQTVLDLGVLAGGAALPEGMTYAAYAHRGAYPLLLTALLAGLFAMASHKMIAGQPFLRAMMYLWLGQNLFLVLTAAFRLLLYVEVYFLTYLRVRAFIWMGLVFVGLCLILFMMVRNKDIAWLIRSNLITAGVTLYLCCFVNFAYLIAEHNFTSWSGQTRLDQRYLCNLGEQALPIIMAFERAHQKQACPDYRYPRLDQMSDWREWGFRRWRLEVYLAENSNEPSL